MLGRCLVLLAEGSTSDLASLGRTLDKALHKIIFDEQAESLALPFIGSGRARAVAATAPFLIKQASTFLKTPHAPQSLKVVHQQGHATHMKAIVPCMSLYPLPLPPLMLVPCVPNTSVLHLQALSFDILFLYMHVICLAEREPATQS